jgi:uncharacterized membrane protein YphA (DoxX/SURF4 family)
LKNEGRLAGWKDVVARSTSVHFVESFLSINRSCKRGVEQSVKAVGLKEMLVSPWAYRIVRFGLGVVFVWAGLVKLADPESFAEIISVYGLVPQALLAPVAIGLPALEFLAGLGLILDVRGSLAVIFGLLTMFVFVLWFGVLKDLDIECGCFSSAEIKEQGALRIAMYRDIAMMAAAAYLFWWRRAARVWVPRGFALKRTVSITS